MNLLTLLPVSAADSTQAESLLDYIAALGGKKPSGAILIVAAPDVHEESRIKLRIAAEIGFESVEVLALPWPKQETPMTKPEAINYLFSQGAQHVSQCYKTPFIWLEADALPLKADWRERFWLSYQSQPKRYMGSIMKDPASRLALSRVAIYPVGAAYDTHIFCQQKIPFELAAMEELVKRATKTTLIQQLPFGANTERSKIREDAVLLHSDKESVLLTALREELNVKPKSNEALFGNAPLTPVEVTQVAPRNGLTDAHLQEATRTLESPPARIDLRTKEGRALKAQQIANA